MPRRTADAASITTARPSLSEDVAGRTRRYLTLMAIRTTCFVFAVAFTDGWVRWICVAGALVLPYIAVIVANGGRENDVAAPEAFEVQHWPALEPGADMPARPDAA